MIPIFIPITINGEQNFTIPGWYVTGAVISLFIIFIRGLHIVKKEFGSPVEAVDFVFTLVGSVLLALIFPATYFVAGMWFLYKKATNDTR